MKRCPQCNRTYADEMFAFCLDDGALLSAPYDPQATLSLPAELTSDLAPITSIDEPAIAISINRHYPHARSAQDLYHATRGIWRVNLERANKAKYAFAVFQGVIREVYEINRWIPVTKETREYWKERDSAQGLEFPPEVDDGRSEFIGELAPESIRQKYIGRHVPVRHTQNPIRYFNC
jgi:uncharacterized protein